MGILIFRNRQHLANIFRFCYRRNRRDDDRPLITRVMTAFGTCWVAFLDVLSLIMWNIRALFGRLFFRRRGYWEVPGVNDAEIPLDERPRFLRRAAAGAPRPEVRLPVRRSQRIHRPRGCRICDECPV